MNTYTACTCIYSLVIFIFILMPGLYYLQTRNFDQNYSLDLIYMYVKEIFLILILHIKRTW